jgi:enamine deaminase RidA (YjgF/YER057c/UK114 family)
MRVGCRHERWFFGAMICMAAASLPAQQPPRQVVVPANYKATTAPYSPGILADGTLYVSGVGSKDANGARPTSTEDKVRQAMRNVRATLSAAGMDYSNVAWMNIYLTHSGEIGTMNHAYWGEIGTDPPARTVLVVSALPDNEEVEINCIAVKDKISRRSIWPQEWPRGKEVDPPAILAGDVVYLSAQSGSDPKTGKIAASFTDETRQALENIQTILASAKLTMKHVLWVNPYMSVSGQYDVMGSVYKTFFEFGNTPARGTIQVMGLPNGSHIVFSCIAGTDLSKRKAIRPRNMPPSPTASPGVLYGNTFYLSAKDGFIPGQGIVTPDFNLQLRQSMRNLLDGLEEADMDFSDVVFSTVYLRKIDDFSRLNPLYRTFFRGGDLPARTTMQQNDDGSAEAAEQISFIAVKTHGHNTVRSEE